MSRASLRRTIGSARTRRARRSVRKEHRLKLDVLYEDNHLLVVNKPPGMVTQGAPSGQVSLHRLACAYLKEKYQKPGKVYLGVVSRLDRGVSGVVVFARTSKAAARLSAALRERRVTKLYWALVSPPPREAEGVWQDFVQRQPHERRTRVVERLTLAQDDASHCSPDAMVEQSGCRDARAQYRVLRTAGRVALVEVELITGRKHQIRAQAAARGTPVVGDRLYGSRLSFPSGIALHARRLVLPHPTQPQTITVEAPLPPAWRQFGPAWQKLA